MSVGITYMDIVEGIKCAALETGLSIKELEDADCEVDLCVFVGDYLEREYEIEDGYTLAMDTEGVEWLWKQAWNLLHTQTE